MPIDISAVTTLIIGVVGQLSKIFELVKDWLVSRKEAKQRKREEELKEKESRRALLGVPARRLVHVGPPQDFALKTRDVLGAGLDIAHNLDIAHKGLAVTQRMNPSSCIMIVRGKAW